MRVPTVRVKDDASPDGYKVINLSDLGDHHELWGEQDQGDHLPAVTAAAEARIAARCFERVMARRWMITLEEWRWLPASERMQRLIDAEAEIERASSPDNAPNRSEEPLRVGKGPGGRFYVKRGRDTITGPFDTEDAANVSLEERRAQP